MLRTGMKSERVSVSDLNKLTRASYILTKINRVARLCGSFRRAPPKQKKPMIKLEKKKIK